MRRLPTATAPQPSRPGSGWLLHPYPRLCARGPGHSESSALAFGARLLATVMLTFALIGVSLALGVSGPLALAGGAAVFYLVGGRRLIRDHRMALGRVTRDGLTDLPNQRAFRDEYPDAVASASRYGDPLALVLLDLDDLELVNDRQGHAEGDSILRVLSGVLRSSRPGDRPYRIGGDEFALLLTHTDAEGARTVVRRLSGDCAQAGVEISVGVSVLRPGLGAGTLRAEAETALYQAKQEGGRRALYFDELQARVAEPLPRSPALLTDGRA